MTMRYLLIAGCMLAAGCLGPREIQATRIHTLDPHIEVKTYDRAEATLGVRTVQAARPYETAMVYVSESKRLHYQPSDVWAESPDDYVTRALVDALSATKRFSDVGYAADMSRPNLILTGELRKFQENRAVTPAVAEIEMRLELRAARDVGHVWGEILLVQVPLEGDTTSAFATAMNEAVAQLAAQAAEAIAQAAG